MGRLAKVSKEVGETNAHLWAENILESPSIRLYFELREYNSAYSLSQTVVQKRHISPPFIEIVEQVIKCEFTEDELAFINQSVTIAVSRAKSEIQTSLFKHFQSIDKEGIALLALKGHIAPESLKRAYRKAALKHHPDLGGSVEKMKRVNGVFALYHDAILNYSANEQGEESFERPEVLPESSDEILSEVILRGACAAGDIFNVSGGESFIKELDENYNIDSTFFLTKVVDMDRAIRRLVEMSAAFGRTTEVDSMTQTLVGWYKKAQEKRIRDIHNQRFTISKSGFLREVSKMYSTKFNIVHELQAEYAYQQGGIDEKRYKNALKRFNRNKEREDAKLAELIEYGKNTKLIPVLNGKSSTPKGELKKAIPDPFWESDRFEFLTDDQKIEYAHTFGVGDSIQLFNKYWYIRRNDYIVQLIYSYDHLDKVKVRAELEIMIRCFNKGYWKFNPALKLLGHLEQMQEGERHEKLRLLRELDENKPRSSGLSFTIDLFEEPESDNTMRIVNSDDYLAFALLDIKDIKKFQQSGEYVNENEMARNRDMELLEKFENASIAKQKDKVLLGGENDPELVINTMGPYINGLLALGEKFHPTNTRELRIGYSINRLTTAYGKQKNWEQVYKWCKLFLDLPENYRGYSPQGEVDKIRKRLGRSERTLGKS